MARLEAITPAANLLYRERHELPPGRRLSPEELSHLGLPRNGDIIEVPKERWVGREWVTRVGLHDGVVYKVALEIECETAEEVRELNQAVQAELEPQLGTPVNGKRPYGWNAEDGNVVLNSMAFAGVYAVTVFFTAGHQIRPRSGCLPVRSVVIGLLLASTLFVVRSLFAR